MRLLIAVTASTIAFSAMAAENPVARLGLSEGWYCSPTGENVLVSAKSSPPFVGIDGLDCHDPIVARGRLTAKTCYANGGIKLSVSKKFAAQGQTLTMDGAVYRLTPQAPGAEACAVPKVQPVATQASTMSDAAMWTHNGSMVLISARGGRIVYDEPKASIAGTVRKGMTLFEGRFDGARIAGTAYVFKRGCEPAPYAVTGKMESNPAGFGSRIVLTGAAPKRDPASCAIIGTTGTHSRLVFEEQGDV
ncbi:MAG: hypothetical protein EOP19_22185 [Hyphomicrobiales bacterium]|nr:MAG: hypothetical protein EOP19_22185 [Hyphomicrobiales bacterium]